MRNVRAFIYKEGAFDEYIGDKHGLLPEINREQLKLNTHEALQSLSRAAIGRSLSVKVVQAFNDTAIVYELESAPADTELPPEYHWVNVDQYPEHLE
jgi:hypothetical protein